MMDLVAAILTIGGTGLKAVDAGGIATAVALHLGTPIPIVPIAAVVVPVETPATDPVQTAEQPVQQTANHKRLEVMAVQTGVEAMTAFHAEEIKNVEAEDQQGPTADKATAEMMIAQHALEIVVKIVAEAPEVQTDQSVKIIVRNKAAQPLPNHKSPSSNQANQANQVRLDGPLEDSLDLVRANDSKFGLRIAPL